MKKITLDISETENKAHGLNEYDNELISIDNIINIDFIKLNPPHSACVGVYINLENGVKLFGRLDATCFTKNMKHFYDWALNNIGYPECSV